MTRQFSHYGQDDLKILDMPPRQPRPTRIAALAYLYHHSLDREDFLALADYLGLLDLLDGERQSA